MTISWLFEIDTYSWSTKAVTFSGTDYTAKVIPSSFAGIDMRYDLSGYLLKPNKLEFEISNTDGTLARADVEGYDCTVRLIVDGSESRVWKFIIKRAVPYYGKMKCYCVDFLKDKLVGEWPRTAHPKEAFPSDEGDLESLDDYCIPVIFGTAYVPVMSVNTGTDRYYVLGSSRASMTSPTYTISEVRSPRDVPMDDVYSSASYSFNQSSNSGCDLAQFIIHDSDGDGSADANGLWWSGQGYYPPLVKYSRSDTSALTSPEEWIEYILKDLGVAAADIDTGAGSSFAAAGTTFSGRGITWNGGFWKKESREKVLADLLRQCDSVLVVTDKIELHPFSATSQETIDKSDVTKLSYEPNTLTQGEVDGGRVHWVEADKPQDKLTGQTVVPLYNSQSEIEQPARDVLKYRFDTDSQNAQDAGILHFAKRFLQKDRMSFRTSYAKLSNLATLLPSQVITLNDSIFGASFDLIITSLTIKKDHEVAIEGVRLEYLEDWGDLSTSILTITGDTATGWRVAVIGASGVLEEDVNWSRIQDDGNRPVDNATENKTFLQLNTPSGDGESTGDVWIDLATGTPYTYDGSDWRRTAWADVGSDPDAPVDNATRNELIRQSSEPNAAAYSEGDLWVDSDNGTPYVHDGFTWNRTTWATVRSDTNAPHDNADVTQSSMHYITVSPRSGEAMYTSLSTAISNIDEDWAGVYLKNGTYSVSSTITLPDYNLSIIGESKQGVVIQSPVNDRLFERTDSVDNSYELLNLTIESRSSSTGYDMIHMEEGAFDFLIHNVKFDLWDDGTVGFTAAGDTGIYINGSNLSAKLHVSGCLFSGGAIGIDLNTVYSADIQGNEFNSQTSRALSIDSLNAFHFNNNNVLNFALYGIYIVHFSGTFPPGGTMSTAPNSKIQGNKFVSVDDSASDHIYGLSLSGKATVSNNQIKINNSRSGAYDVYGISIDAAIEEGSINNNSISITSDITDDVWGILLKGCLEIVVSGNTINIDTADADVIEGITCGFHSSGQWSSRNNISNNVINLTDDTLDTTGIWLGNGADYNYGDGNITYNCNTSVDDANGGTGNSVSTSSIALKARNGIYLGGGTDLLDDYEEGTYTVTCTPDTSGSVTLDSTADVLAYTKKGREVTIYGEILVDSVSSPSGFLTFSLPFTKASATERSDRASSGLGVYRNISFDSGGYTQLSARAAGSGFVLEESGDGIGRQVYGNSSATFTGDEGLAISLTYYT